MANPVDVSSIDVLQSVRDAIILFTEEAQSALGAMDAEVRRCIDWLAHDQRVYWQGEVKRRNDKLSEAKAELHRKQVSQMHGGNAHDSEQRESVREAKRRLEEAEDKVEAVLRWVPIVEHAMTEYRSQASPFADSLEFEVERSTEMLSRMILALEDYIRDAPPISRAPQGAIPSATPAPSPVAEAEAEANDEPETPDEEGT